MSGRRKVRSPAAVALAALLLGVSATGAVAAVIEGTNGNDVLTGTPDADVLRGLAGADVVHGLGGRDLLSGHEGNDELYGDAGRDFVWGYAGNDVQRGGGGPDQLTDAEGLTSAGADRLYGGPGPDYLGSVAGPDRLYGGGQDDELHTESPDVVADGGPGDDVLRAFYDENRSATGSVLRGADGDDTLTTWVSDTELWGGDGADALTVEVSRDVLVAAGPGNDTVMSNYGIDVPTMVNHVDCGPGNDVARVGSRDTVSSNCETVLLFPS